MDAAAIVGLLAEPERRRVVAALVLGDTTPEEIRDRTGLDLRAVVDALARLTAGGLVIEGERRWFLLEEAFGDAARAAAPVPSEPDGDVPAEQARVLRAFVRNGRLVSIPAQRSKRLVVLDHLAQLFEPGEHYAEPTVNLMLGLWHPDTAALRRYLVDEGFLDRAGGHYWRSGGTVRVGEG